MYAISPMLGVEAQLPSFMQTTHVVSNDKTARNYVKRLRAMGDKLDEVTADMQRQAKAGVVLPAALLERSLIVIQDTVAAKPEENALVTSFVERMNKVKSLDGPRKQQLEREAVEALKTQCLSGLSPA